MSQALQDIPEYDTKQIELNKETVTRIQAQIEKWDRIDLVPTLPGDAMDHLYRMQCFHASHAAEIGLWVHRKLYEYAYYIENLPIPTCCFLPSGVLLSRNKGFMDFISPQDHSDLHPVG